MSSEATAQLVYRCTICHAVYTAGERFCPLDAGPIKPEDQHTDPRIGKTIDGRYFIRRLIGRGGMGAVYEADHVGLDKRVAVKFLSINKTDRDALARFRREAKIASRIVHEHVVQIYDVGTADADTDFIVMEYLEGRDLALTLRDGPLDATRTVSIVRKVLRGLRAIHQAGIVHRDIKPANILISPRDDDRDFVKIMDFGISKPIHGGTITNTGAIIGTPEYMAPEQLLGDDVDPRADLYAVGIMTYRMLTGRLPFTFDTFDRSAAANPYVPVPSLAAQRADLPRELIHAVEKATSKVAGDRFADAQEFVAALEAIATPSQAVAPDGATARTASQRMNGLGGADTVVAEATPAPIRRELPTEDARGKTVTEEARGGSQAGWSPATPATAPQSIISPLAPRRSRLALGLALGVVAAGGVVIAVVLGTRKGADPAPVAEVPPAAPASPALPAGSPSATPPSAKDKVVATLQRAREADGKGDLGEALTAYQAAYTIEPSPETTYAIAELHERLGHKEDAIRFYERYLMAAKDAPNRDTVTKKLAALQTAPKPASSTPAPPTAPNRDAGLRPCHCIPQDRRDTVSMCAKKGPSRCRCTTTRGTSLCPSQVTECPPCADGTKSCQTGTCQSYGFACADPNFEKQRRPGKHGDACSGYEIYALGPELTGTLDCDHCDEVPEPRQFKGHEGDECVGYYRPTGEQLKGWLICY